MTQWVGWTGKACEQCGEREAILDTCCPSCGTKSLCVECIIEHIAQIAEQAGRHLGP